MDRYSRNRIYISGEEQKKVAETGILLAGAGIGSVIAECALRFGFENLTIVDGKKVKEGDLNGQNYVPADIGKPKVECLSRRLVEINPNADIKFLDTFIDKENAGKFVAGHDVAVNALDFKDDVPFVLERICAERKVSVLHPFNFGWGGFLTIVSPEGHQLSEIFDSPDGFELKLSKYVTRYGSFWNEPVPWLEDVIREFEAEKGARPMPQLSVASWIVAGHCVNAMFNLATGRPVKFFPKFYFSSIM